MKVNCKTCNKKINISPSRFRIDGNCCSKKCLGLDTKGEHNVKCYICKKSFHLKPYHLRKMKNKERVCCSRECSKKERSERFMGERNHQHGLKGELNSSFKSDIQLTHYGYVYVRNSTHPFRTQDDFVFLHRLVFEEYCKKTNNLDYLIEVDGNYYLSPDFVIHHRDENKFNNTLDNLVPMYLGEHITFHNKSRQQNQNVYTGKFERGSTKGNQLFRQRNLDAGNDIFSDEEIVIKSRSSSMIKTGTFIKLPSGHIGLLWSRSGLSVKHKLEVGAGCIDENYRGEIIVHLYNHGEKDYIVRKGDKIAQLLVMPVNLTSFEVVEQLPDSDRNTEGFGSSGR